MASASFSCHDDQARRIGYAGSAVQKLPQRFRTLDQCGGMAIEQVEKALLMGHERLKPSKHVVKPSQSDERICPDCGG
jgi:hypothetical protein